MTLFLDSFFGLCIVIISPVVLAVLYVVEKKHRTFREPTEYLKRIKNSLE
jgi:hypothetical protein